MSVQDISRTSRERTAEDGWRGLRALDHSSGLSKGSAFRAFKSLSQNWRENLDFQLLDPDIDHEHIARLKHDGAVYRSSIKVIMVSAARADELLAAMARGARIR